LKNKVRRTGQNSGGRGGKGTWEEGGGKAGKYSVKGFVGGNTKKSRALDRATRRRYGNKEKELIIGLVQTENRGRASLPSSYRGERARGGKVALIVRC